MRSLFVVVAVAAALSAAFYFLYATPDADSLSLASSDTGPGGARWGPVTETAVLFGMLVAVGLAGVKAARAD